MLLLLYTVARAQAEESEKSTNGKKKKIGAVRSVHVCSVRDESWPKQKENVLPLGPG